MIDGGGLIVTLTNRKYWLVVVIHVMIIDSDNSK